MAKHIQTIRRLLPTNCLSVFDHFVGFAPKGLIKCNQMKTLSTTRGILKNYVFLMEKLRNG